MVCAAVLNESETPLKRNPVLIIYISSTSLQLVYHCSGSFSSLWASAYHAPSKKREEDEKMEAGRRREEEEKGGGEGEENNRNLVVLVLSREY